MELKKLFLLSSIIFLFSFPWFNSGSTNYFDIPEVRQEGNPFYESNPCEVSFVEFLITNPKSIYQDHYFFRPNDLSSISCFGRISGVTVLEKNLETQFIISIGSNSFINLLLQGTIWTLILTLLKRSVDLKDFKYDKKQHYISALISSYLFTFSIYAEKRFYEGSLFMFDFTNKYRYFLIYSILFLLIFNLSIVVRSRLSYCINYLPFIYLFTGIFSGYNLTFFSLLFIYFGIISLFYEQKNNKYLKYYIFVSMWWLINSNGSFFFNVGKIRGFTSSNYEFNSNLYWIIYFGLLILGIIKLYKLTRNNLDFSELTKNYSIVSISMVVIGLLGSNFPVINYLTYYFFGLQRYVIESKNPIAIDDFNERISWRGMFPSSETVGEFYGLYLILVLFFIVKNQKLRIVDIFGVIFSSLGLYFSDNRTTIVLVFLIILFYLLKENFHLDKYFRFLFTAVILTLAMLIILLIIGSNNYQLSYDFMSKSVFNKSLTFKFDSVFSSFMILINQNLNQNNFIGLIFGFFSSIGFLLNRSEMWGLFFARYNPTLMELLIGSGPLNLGQLYGETLVIYPDSFLLPHSSFLSYLVFFGMIPLTIVTSIFVKTLVSKVQNIEFKIILIFIFINVFKNDSLNYFSVFVFYALIIMIFYENSFFLKNKKEFS